ncbi:MAG: hypothetical protein V3T83_03010 [Acidobacteriota bacterium]
MEDAHVGCRGKDGKEYVVNTGQQRNNSMTPRSGKTSTTGRGTARGSIVLGVVGIALLFVAAAFGWRGVPALAEGVIAFLSGAMAWTGIRLCVLAMDPEMVKVWHSPEYVFLSGVAVIWTAIDTLAGKLV